MIARRALQRIILNVTRVLIQAMEQMPIGQLAIDSAGRLRIIIDAAGVAIPVSQSGTWTVHKGGTWTIDAGGVFPVDQRWEIIQRSYIEFEQCQRQKFTFTP